MAPPANPEFDSPLLQSSKLSEPTNLPLKNATVNSPLPTRGNSQRDEDRKPTNSRTPTKQPRLPSQLLSARHSSHASLSMHFAKLPLATIPASPLLPLCVTPPNELPDAIIPQQPQIIQPPNSFNLSLTGLPLRNRRMTAPTHLRPMSPGVTPSTPPNLQSPTNSPIKSSPVSESDSTALDSDLRYEIRNPLELLEAVQAYPNETFNEIQALGYENLSLQSEAHSLRSELDDAKIQNIDHILRMNDGFTRVLNIEWTKQNLLHDCIERLENEISLLRGGGRVVQGVWMSDAEYGVPQIFAESPKTDWDELAASKLERDMESSSSSKSAISDQDYEGKGKGKEILEPRFNPNAQSFIPIVANSPGGSDTTEIFSPVRPPHGSTIGVLQADDSIDSTTYTSPHRPFPNLAPTTGPSSPSDPPNSPKTSLPNPIASTSSSIPPSVLDAIINTLPPLFRQICPYSLTDCSPCPLHDCPMKKLCQGYNIGHSISISEPQANSYQPTSPHSDPDPSPGPYPSLVHQKSQPKPTQEDQPPQNQNNNDERPFCNVLDCQFVHEYATCLPDLTIGKLKKGLKYNRCEKRGKLWKNHEMTRVHRNRVLLEDWRVRQTVATLRDAHREGMYL